MPSTALITLIGEKIISIDYIQLISYQNWKRQLLYDPTWKAAFAWLWAAVQGSETHKVNLCRIFIIALHESVHFRNKSDLKHNWVPLKEKYFYTFYLLRSDASTLYVK